MAITASQVTTNNSLEQFRQEFNNLQSDVRGLESGTVSFSTVSTNLQLILRVQLMMIMKPHLVL